jgi:hypothetical protein
MSNDRKILYIDSTSQLASNKNVFTVTVDSDITSDYDMCSLISAQIPVSFYILQDGYNTFTLREGLQTVTMTIPQGNYSVYSFQSTVGALLTASSPNGYTYSLLFSNIFTQVDTGKYTFQCSNTVTQISFKFPANNAVSEPFGFDSGTTVYFTNGTLQSSNVVSFIPETSIFVHASFVQGATQSGFSDVLACIFSSNAAPYSTINYINPQIYETAKQTCNLTKVMTFSLTDEYGSSILLNGGNTIFQILLFKSNSNPIMSEMKRGFKLIEDYINMKTKLLEYDYKQKDEESSRQLEYTRRKIEDQATLIKTQLEISSKLDILIDLFNTQSSNKVAFLKNTTNKDDSTVENQNNNGQEREFNPQLDQSQIPYQEGLI